MSYVIRETAPPSSVAFHTSPEDVPMLTISENGFWVRGVKVEQDENEAKNVYNAFCQWMTYNSLTRNY